METQTQLLHGDEVFHTLREEWDALASRSMTDTPFQTLAYQESWWRHLQPPESRLVSIAVRDMGGELIAVACLFLQDGVLHFNGCIEETDYLDLIASPELAKAGWRAVLSSLIGPEFPEWHALDLCNVPEQSPTRSILAELARENGFSFSEEAHEVCPVISLPQTFDDYLGVLPKKQRHEIRRKLRRAQGAGVEFTTIGPDDDIVKGVNAFLDLLQKSTIEKRDWLNDGRRAVFHETAKAAQEAGTLQLMFSEVEGQKAAALFNFVYRDRVWVYNSGLDPEAFGHLSLGVALTARSIESAIEQNLSSFDFLRGNETYKYRFGAEDTTIFRLHISRDA